MKSTDLLHECIKGSLVVPLSVFPSVFLSKTFTSRTFFFFFLSLNNYPIKEPKELFFEEFMY